MGEIVDFDPNYPLPCSDFLEAMVGIFRVTAREAYEKNETTVSKLVKSILAANSHFAYVFQSNEKKALGKKCIEYEEMIEKLREEHKSISENITRANEQEALYRVNGKELSEKMKEMRMSVDEMLKQSEHFEQLEREIEKADAEIKQKDEEIAQLKVAAQRHELMVEYVEIEKRGVIKYAELQVLELQKELVKMRINEFERDQEVGGSPPKETSL